MDWRIIVPLLCLIGILHVPGNAAQANNSTTTNPATTQNASLAMTQNASLATTQNASLATTQNASLATTQNASLATTQNASLAKTQNASLVTKSTDAPTTTAPVARVNLGFSIRQNFSENFSNLSHPETQALINNITNEFTPFYKRSYPNFLRMTIKSFRKGSIVVDSVLEFNTTIGSSPNATDVKDNFVKAITSGNFSIPVDNTSISAAIPETTATNTTATPATNTTASPVTNTTATSATTVPAKVAQINLLFSIIQTFSENFTDLNHPETQVLTTKVISECSAVYRRRFPKFFRMFIRKFSKGSVVVDSVLEFDTTNGTSPNTTELKGTLVQGIANGNFSFPVDNTSISASDISNATNTTATPATNTTASPVTNITATSATTVPAKVAQVNLLFSIIQTFSENFTDLNHPETQVLTTKVINECSAVYRRRFPKFLRMFIRKFSKGSVVVDSVLEFDTTNGTSPNTTELKDTLVQGIASGNFSFSVDNTSISASDISNGTTTANITTTTQATTVSAASTFSDYNITFKLNEVFTSDLTDMTSAGAIKLAKNITTELDGYFKKFQNFNRTVVLRFRNGSIDTDGQIRFDGKSNNPTASDLATGLADAVRKGIVKLSIDPKSIKVTDPSGVSANRSPMLASMLTALWMTLASLLLSAVMH